MPARAKRKPKAACKRKCKRKAAVGPFVCYVLQHRGPGGRTYTGQTNNFARRLKQHRGILAGGARYTSRVANGALWTPMFRVTGFATLRSVLQFELAMKRRRRPAALLPTLRGPRGRVLQLEHLFNQGTLTDEPHSPFAANGIAVECHLSVARYLEYAGLTETEFVQRRTAQGIGFAFVG